MAVAEAMGKHVISIVRGKRGHASNSITVMVDGVGPYVMAQCSCGRYSSRWHQSRQIAVRKGEEHVSRMGSGA